ncbi:hypothetical protein HJC23_008379 [Cyclotella cryptica]|uniref:PDZ GRASP-type domain-containing protein n=1 Tax=Cyclotella cryptica TaxID=29204 RepID=A0ABD3PIL9_9STRA|eukprot:CCRYP_014024-RA/>CCRYP_014024-RA protein AED:0.04 eAED:0.04 QI:235/1/1/1/1/1/2/113/385
MGNDASTHYEEPEDEFSKFDGIETLGYRVLGVQPNSPASAAGLVSFLDFLVGCNGVMLMGSGEGLEEGEEYDDVDFPALLRDNEGKELELLVHNIKSNSQRLVKIKPSSSWGGAGLLGVTIRLDNYGGADERLIRVLSVEHNSPAAIAGLAPMNDYLLGTTSASFDSDDVLAEVLMMHVDRIVEIYVYSSESDLVRVVTLMPTKSWGGRGLLGAEVGTGYLHRFPKSCRGTDGKSVERKVRMGVRPTEASAFEGEKLANDMTSQDIDNETAITDEVSGKTMCFAEQMEMEPEPSEGQRHGDAEPVKNKHNNETSTSQTGGEYSNEADTIFSRPPPGNAVLTPKQQRTSDAVPARVMHHGQLPPPPYASYSSQNPPQPVSPSVDLR